MRRHSTRLVTVMGIVAISLLLMSAAAQCTLTEGGGTISVEFPSASPNGKVVDVQGNGLDGVELTLEYLSGAPADEEPDQNFTGSTDSAGEYSISDSVPYGTYRLTAKKDGYVFIDEVVDVSNETTSTGLPTVIGFSYNEDIDNLTVNIIAMWNQDFGNVDAHLTFPNDWKGEAVGQSDTAGDGMSTPYDTFDTNVSAGFFADTASDLDRLHLSGAAGETKATDDTVAYYREGGDDDRVAVEFENSPSSGPGPEAVAIREIPILWDDSLSFDTDPTADNELPSGAEYGWMGVAQYYVHGDSALMTEGESVGSDLTIYVTQGDKVLGKYRLPEYTTVNAASIMRINLFAADDGTDFYSYMQIVPNLRIIENVDPGDDFRPAAMDADTGIINLKMGAR